jgi:hypothetical protein
MPKILSNLSLNETKLEMVEKLWVNFGGSSSFKAVGRQSRENRGEPNDAFPENIIALFVDCLRTLVLYEIVFVNRRGNLIHDSLFLARNSTISI